MTTQGSEVITRVVCVGGKSMTMMRQSTVRVAVSSGTTGRLCGIEVCSA